MMLPLTKAFQTERELWEHSIDPDCVQRLNRILQQTGTRVGRSTTTDGKVADGIEPGDS